MNPLVSVIVPVYGIERYIGTCVESILRQTYTNLEIILVDDGSKDRCGEICDLYANNDKRVVVIHKENGGLVSARKAGIEKASGKYICNIDGDDWVEEDYINVLVGAAEKDNADIAIAGHSRDLFEKKAQFESLYACGVYKDQKLDALRKDMLSYGGFYRIGVSTYLWGKLFTKDVLKDAQLAMDDRISIGEDAATTYPAIFKATCISIIDSHSYHYRQREDSMLKKRVSFVDEVKKLKYLYDYMISYARTTLPEFNFEKQVIDFVLGKCLMLSGGIVNDDFQEELFGYNGDFKDKSVVVYSAGTFGQHLVSSFEENNHCKLVGWIDDDYWEYRRCAMQVDSVESIQSMIYDYVLIASIDSYVAAEVKIRLNKLGVDDNKILTIHCPEEIREEKLKAFFSLVE